MHAINSLRKLCNKQARDETVRKVVGNQRLQFIPLQWRSSLQFDELSREEKEAEDGLDNRFSLEDLQVEGCELNWFYINVNACGSVTDL